MVGQRRSCVLTGMRRRTLGEALGFGNVRTLILSRSAVGPCLSAPNEDPGTSGNNRWLLPINTLIIYPGPPPSLHFGSYQTILLSLLKVAQKRKVVGFPFKSVSLFLCGDLEWEWDGLLKELGGCVEKLEVVAGDDVLDWSVDKYFLDGVKHLQ